MARTLDEVVKDQLGSMHLELARAQIRIELLVEENQKLTKQLQEGKDDGSGHADHD